VVQPTPDAPKKNKLSETKIIGLDYLVGDSQHERKERKKEREEERRKRKREGRGGVTSVAVRGRGLGGDLGGSLGVVASLIRLP
jgi:hypothetical protein